MRRGALLLLWLALGAPATAQPAGPPGPYVLDVRGAMAGLPSAVEFLPAVPPTTVVPARGFGLDAGVHVYPFHVGAVRLGIGAMATVARGTASPLVVAATSPSSSTTPAKPATPLPDITTNFATWAPTLSLNFGHRDGWSYVSAGAGRSRLRTRATGSASDSDRLAEAIPTINVGGGARWFTRAHLAVTFDARFYRLAAATSTLTVPAAATPSTGATGAATAVPPPTVTTAATPPTRLFVLSVGLSLR